VQGVSRLEATALHVGMGQQHNKHRGGGLPRHRLHPKRAQGAADVPYEHMFAQDSPGRHIGGKVSTLVFIDQLCGACYVFPLGLGCPSCSRKQE